MFTEPWAERWRDKDAALCLFSERGVAFCVKPQGLVRSRNDRSLGAGFDIIGSERISPGFASRAPRCRWTQVKDVRSTTRVWLLVCQRRPGPGRDPASSGFVPRPSVVHQNA